MDSPDRPDIGQGSISAITIRWYITGLCLLGMIRVFIGCAVFPFFGNVDEYAHFDLVNKYSNGVSFEKIEHTFNRESAEFFRMYGSMEYLYAGDKLPGGAFPPPRWRWPDELSRQYEPLFEESITRDTQEWNHEVGSPPVYYWLAAMWYDFGHLFCSDKPQAVYWIRFLNIPLIALLIIASHQFCSAYYSQRVALTVPLLVAIFPGPTFWSINSDALSPLLSLFALWALLCWTNGDRGAWFSVATGGLVAAAFLVKLTNVMLLGIMACAALIALRRAVETGGWRPFLVRAACMLIACAVPISLWMARNRVVFGDWTGTHGKAEWQGWTLKPISLMFDHPLFSLAGEYTYWGPLAMSFFLGDLNWHGRHAMGGTWLDSVFKAMFALAVIGPVALLIVNRRSMRAESFRASASCWLLIMGTVAFLMWLSVRWDFGPCWYPSRDYPFFNSGRFLYGAFIPVVLMYVYVVDAVTARSSWLFAIVIAMSVAVMVLPQCQLLQDAYQSQYNWFHLP